MDLDLYKECLLITNNDYVFLVDGGRSPQRAAFNPIGARGIYTK